MRENGSISLRVAVHGRIVESVGYLHLKITKRRFALGERPEERETDSGGGLTLSVTGGSQEERRRIAAKIWWSLGYGRSRTEPDSGSGRNFPND